MARLQKRKLPSGIIQRGNFLHIRKIIQTKSGRKEKIQESTGFTVDQLTEAKAYLDQVTREYTNGNGKLKTEKTFEDVARRFLGEAQMSKGGLSDYKSTCRRLHKFGLSEVSISKLHVMDVKPFVQKRVKEVSNRTIDKHIGFINVLKNLASKSS